MAKTKQLIQEQHAQEKPIIVMEHLKRINVWGYNLEEGLQDTYDEDGAPVNRVSGVNLNDNHYMIWEDDVNHQQIHSNTPEVCLPTRVWRLQQYFPNVELAIGRQEDDSELVKRVALAVYEKQVAKLREA